ncbi:Crp/Fnr family transcriptional regulator [Mucilaginibacter xinganensis]|nr:Crp/Fnr family transcriptional regulator [Mucilaginibacter xinganensis]
MEPLLAFLRSFRPISAEEAAIIIAHFEAKHFEEGEYLFRAGRVCKDFFFITSGILRIVTTNDKGVDVTHYFIGENQLCTILKSFNEETIARDSIQACCAVRVLSINKRSLSGLYQKLPFMADLVNQVNQERMLEKIRIKNAYSGEDAAQRYKVFIAEQADIAYRVPLNYIASYLNITPQSLSRIRRNRG